MNLPQTGHVTAVHEQKLARVQAGFELADVEVAELSTLWSVDPGVVAVGPNECHVRHIHQDDAAFPAGRNSTQYSLDRDCTIVRAILWSQMDLVTNHIGDVVQHQRVAECR